MEYLEIAINQILCFVEYFTFFYVVFREKFRKKTMHSMILGIVCYIVFFAGSCFYKKLSGQTIPFAVLLCVIFFVIFHLYDVSVFKMIGLAIGEWLVLCIEEMSMLVILQALQPDDRFYESEIMLFISILLWCYYLIWGRNLNRTLFQIPVKMIYFVDSIMLILTAMLKFFFYQITVELPQGHMNGFGRLFIALGGNFITILLFTMISYCSITQKLKMEKNLSERLSELQREHFENLMEREKETRKFRHDIIDELLQIRSYNDKRDYEGLRNYLSDMLGEIESISRQNYDVGNDIINTVLNHYFQPVKEKYDIRICGYIDQKLSIDQRDLCIVIANLVKNAVEAVTKLEKGQIIFTISQGKQYLTVKVENSFGGKIEFDEDGIPKTTKDDEDMHGIGTKKVKDIVRQYQGEYYSDIRNCNFFVEVFLKCESGRMLQRN